MGDNASRAYPGRWGELADLLRETHTTLERADAQGVPRCELTAVSRAAMRVVADAAKDVDTAVERAGLVVLEARELVRGVP